MCYPGDGRVTDACIAYRAAAQTSCAAEWTDPGLDWFDSRLSGYMFETCEWILAWWRLGVVTASEVVAWADREIASREASACPEWLMDLSLEGPHRFFQQARDGQPRPRVLGFEDCFFAYLERLDPDDSEAVEGFGAWFASAALGESVEEDLVRLGYALDHAMDYETDINPADLVREVILCYRPSATRIRETLAAPPVQPA